jgi:hypothetical protein
MNFDLDIGQWIVIALSAFLFLWYFLAGSLNRKRGTAAYRWLRQGMETIGKISDAEWIGASNMGARLTVKKAKKPFRRVESHYLLEPREFLPYWLASRLKGKRDEVLISAVLRIVPKESLEIQREAGKRPGQLADSGRIDPGFQLVGSELEDTQLLDKVNNFLAEYGETVERIVIQRNSPHLEIYARIKPLLDSPAESYFGILLTLFQDM